MDRGDNTLCVDLCMGINNQLFNRGENINMLLFCQRSFTFLYPTQGKLPTTALVLIYYIMQRKKKQHFVLLNCSATQENRGNSIISCSDKSVTGNRFSLPETQVRQHVSIEISSFFPAHRSPCFGCGRQYYIFTLERSFHQLRAVRNITT